MKSPMKSQTKSKAHRPGRVTAAVMALLTLAACSTTRRPPGDDAPTIASLSQRRIALPADTGIRADEAAAIAAWQAVLDTGPQVTQRSEALRRLGDLEMDRADRAAGDGAAADYRGAIARYETLLQSAPDAAQRDRVLYQLARAQEQGGAPDAAMQTLERLVREHPDTALRDEVQFRRGEVLFAHRDYAQAEAAYTAVLHDDKPSPLHERALYMQGWSRFKQGRLDDSLDAFFALLDAKLGPLQKAERDEPDLAALPTLTRADRELLEDSFRVMSLSLASLQGAASIAPHVGSSMGNDLRRGYEFRVFAQLAALYVRQDRIKDAADTLQLFVQRQPLHAQAPQLLTQVIALSQRQGFESLALQAQRELVEGYGAGSPFEQAQPAAWALVQPQVQASLAALARHHHALAQRSHERQDVQQAERWYRRLLAVLPDDVDAARQRFLLAELLYDDRQWAAAAIEYEQVAYGEARPAQAADAGYAALLAYAAQEKQAADATARAALQRQASASALRFATTHGSDARSAAVLTHAAEQLQALGEGEQADAVARQVLASQPVPAPELRRSAWTVLAQGAFERQAWADAEQAYSQVLALTAAGSAAQRDNAERLAAAIYKQGEQARADGDARAAVGHFSRIAELGAAGGLAAGSAVRASAQFDAAAALIGLKDWEAAARALADFRREQPGHALAAEVAPRLALVYLELGRDADAAAEFEGVAAQATEPEAQRNALWQAAELRQKAAASAAPRSALLAAAQQAWERYLQAFAQPLPAAVEARWHLALLARQNQDAATAQRWARAVQQADHDAGEARTALTRQRAGEAALLLTEPLLAAYRQVALVEPLQKQLKLKKTRMEALLAAYAAAAETAGPAALEVHTAATFHTAALVQDFGQALMSSARPKKLKPAELEQYNVMLEEQAFPFEEQAIALHEGNAARTAQGVYDTWVQQSLAELARLKPARWNKPEHGDATLPSELSALQAALKPHADDARLLNQLGIAERRAGHFDAARTAYEAAIAADAQAAAPLVNLAILHDLYLGDAAQAQVLYQRCLALSPGDAPALSRWLAELKSRKPAAATVATTVSGRKETLP
jgi:tetratricopeptide (TPR) repeat protein